MSREEKKEAAGRSGDPARFFLKPLEGLDGLAGDPALKEVCKAALGQEVYLVGGALRNLALSAPIARDYDFALRGDTAGFARELALRLGGTAFPLDEGAGSYRVVAGKGEGATTLDFTAMGQGGIGEDLGKRDFTMNATAVEVSALCAGGALLIDPFGGLEDARALRLRTVSGSAFDDDPLRMLRAVRLARQYGLEIAPETLELIGKKAGIISRASPERIRDELKWLFLSGGTAEGIELLYATGLVEGIIPEAGGWADVDGYDLLGHSLAVLREAEALLAGLSEETFPGFSGRLKEYFSGREGELSNLGVFKLAAFLHDFGKAYAASREGASLRFLGHDTAGAERAKEVLERLRFGGKTAREVSFFIRNHHRVFMLAGLKERSFRVKSHFFRASGDSGGLMLLCLALADARATRGAEDPGLYSAALEMLDFYYGVYTVKRPGPLLSGLEIMGTFGLEEGPAVGEIIREIDRAVEKGAVRTRGEAVRHIREWLKEKAHSR